MISLKELDQRISEKMEREEQGVRGNQPRYAAGEVQNETIETFGFRNIFPPPPSQQTPPRVDVESRERPAKWSREDRDKEVAQQKMYRKYPTKLLSIAVTGKMRNDIGQTIVSRNRKIIVVEIFVNVVVLCFEMVVIM